MIDNSQLWQRKITSTITQNYKNSPFWTEGGEQLCELITKRWEHLVDFWINKAANNGRKFNVKYAEAFQMVKYLV